MYNHAVLPVLTRSTKHISMRRQAKGGCKRAHCGVVNLSLDVASSPADRSACMPGPSKELPLPNIFMKPCRGSHKQHRNQQKVRTVLKRPHGTVTGHSSLVAERPPPEFLFGFPLLCSLHTLGSSRRRDYFRNEAFPRKAPVPPCPHEFHQ